MCGIPGGTNTQLLINNLFQLNSKLISLTSNHLIVDYILHVMVIFNMLQSVS